MLTYTVSKRRKVGTRRSKTSKSWLGLSTRDYNRTPHTDEPIRTLWWFRELGDSDRSVVIAAYIGRVKRGVRADKFDNDLQKKLHGWLEQLSNRQPLTGLYWSVPTFAKANGLDKFTLMKRLRGLADIAEQQHPDRAPMYRRKITDETKAEIREMFREHMHDMKAFEMIADKFAHLGVTEARAEQICRDLKLAARAARETAVAPSEMTSADFDDLDSETF